MLIKSKTSTKSPGTFTDDVHWSEGESYHIRNVVRVHLIQVLIIDVRIGKVKPVRLEGNVPLNVKLTAYPLHCQPDQHGQWPHTHPSTRSPMLSKWPRNVRQWYCWLVSISDVFWTHSSARVCCNTHTQIEGAYKCMFKSFKQRYSFYFLKSVQTAVATVMQHSERKKRENILPTIFIPLDQIHGIISIPLPKKSNIPSWCYLFYNNNTTHLLGPHTSSSA